MLFTMVGKVMLVSKRPRANVTNVAAIPMYGIYVTFERVKTTELRRTAGI